MVKDAPQEAHQEGQEQRLVGNGLLKVTVTALIFRKWHVDETSPSRSRWFFLDGLAAGGFGAINYVRAWWEIPLDDLSLSEELAKVPIGSILSMASEHITFEPGKDFHLDEKPVPEDSPQVAIGMKAPDFSLVDPGKLECNQLDQLLAGLKSFVPEDGIFDHFQSEVERLKNPLNHEFIIQKLTDGCVGS